MGEWNSERRKRGMSTSSRKGSNVLVVGIEWGSDRENESG
jgi:hypothetical protein